MAALQKTSTSNVREELFRLITPNTTVIIGLSGGPDSVYLLHHVMHVRESLGLSLIAAHLDHEWRASSKDDVAFCQRLCAGLQIPLEIGYASHLTHTIVPNGSQEEVGRKLRRLFLEQVRAAHQASDILLAHHQDDQLETFFINLIRGTTIAGLGGMKAHDGFFVRPLLQITKQDILAYLAEHSIPYQIDPTNESDAYLRNRIRSNLIPAFAACDDRSKKNLTRAMKNLEETERFLKIVTEQALVSVVAPSETDHRTLDLQKFFALNPYLQYRVLAQWLSLETNGAARSSESFLQEIMRFLQSPRGGTHELSPEWELEKAKGLLSLKHR